MKKLLLVFLLIACATASAQIGAKVQQQSKLTGIWQNNQFGYQMTLMLNDNGSGEFDGDAIKYTANDGKLSLTIVAQNETTIYSYALTGNDLTVSGGDLEQPVKFSRAGSGTPATATAPSTATASSQPPAAGNIDKNLLGTWSGNNESMEFRADGKVIFNGAAIDYQVSQGHIIVTMPQGQAMMAYTVTGNEMKLTANGTQATYTRGAAGNAPAATSPGGRSVPQELAGKWCWINVGSNNASMSSECWTMKADGTYSYYSESSRSVNTTSVTGGTASQGWDSGIWWVEGDRLFYQSQTQGQGSYKLEKRNHPKNTSDPMIVLNGQPYVTATYRQPWR